MSFNIYAIQVLVFNRHFVLHSPLLQNLQELFAQEIFLNHGN